MRPDQARGESAPDPEVLAIVERLGLSRLPIEGTYYRSTYSSEARAADGGPAATAMLGLYSAAPRSVSLFHRLDRDEVWHFYAGDPFVLILLCPEGGSEEVLMGSDVLGGQTCQLLVPAGTWQAGRLAPGGRWALYGCSVAPGFVGSCFEAGTAPDLLARYPERAADIDELALSGGETRMPQEGAR